MPLIKRTKLARGTRIVPQHFNEVPLSASAIITGSGFSIEQMQTRMATFQMNWNIPVIRSTWGDDNRKEHPIMFTLPPLQDEWNKDYIVSQQTNQNTLVVKLQEVSISFDQGGNPTSITDTYGEYFPGMLSNTPAQSYNILLKLYEKTPQKIDQSVKTPDKLLFSQLVDSSNFISFLRFNPFTLENLNISLNPYKTYTWTIGFPNGLTHDNIPVCLPNFNLKATFKTFLKKKDSFQDLGNAGFEKIQNYPLVLTESFKPSLDINPVFPGDLITADATGSTTSGSSYNYNLKQIDKLAVQGYVGGLTTTSNTRPNATIESDNAYDVIVVPLFCGSDQVRRFVYNFGNTGTLDILPFTNTATSSLGYTRTMDRRVIPIDYPFVIHHVYCATSFYAPDTKIPFGNPISTSSFVDPGQYRLTSSLEREVGVLIGKGCRQDGTYTYQQVAYTSMNGDVDTVSGSTNLVDRIQIQNTYPYYKTWGSSEDPFSLVSIRNKSYDSELWQVPIVGKSFIIETTTEEVDYWYSGSPFFVGKSSLATATRSNVANQTYAQNPSVSTVSSSVSGSEQWIEVRGLISDVNGLKASSSFYHQDIINGTTGWYVYLIGKRTLT